MDTNNELTRDYIHLPSKHATLSAFRIARERRLEPTEAEEALWALLRSRQLNGKKFRRQHPMANHVFDFYCHEARLAVELDENDENVEVEPVDKIRTELSYKLGVTVIRFWSEDVINYPYRVMEKIASFLPR